MELVDHSDRSSSAELRTPRGALKTYHALTLDGDSNDSYTVSPMFSPSNRESDDDEDDVTMASLLGLSENETFLIFGYLNFDEALQISKTCKRLHDLSFKLMPRLTPRCKSVRGVTDKDLSEMIGQCSDYLKHIDLTAVSAVVTNSVIDAIGKQCTQLTHVSFHGCEAITDDAIITFLKNCPFVRELDLSGCYKLTPSIAPQLAKCTRLRMLNLSWCSNMDCNLIPYLLLMNANGELRECWLHSTNRHVSLFGAFEGCFNRLEQNKENNPTSKTVHKLKDSLTIKGGLQSKYTNEVTLEEQIEYLKHRNIVFISSFAANIRSLSEWQFDYKMNLLKSSKKMHSWRLYTQTSSNKIYLVLQTEFGVFGTKLIPLLDFQVPRKELIEKLVESRRDPIDLLKKRCGLDNWTWTKDFQSKRTLSLLGFKETASWIEHTASRCPGENVVYAAPEGPRAFRYRAHVDSPGTPSMQ